MHQGGGTLPPLICFRQLDPRPAPEIPRLNLRSVVVLNPNFATSMAGPVFGTSQLAFAGMVSLVLFLFLAVVP